MGEKSDISHLQSALNPLTLSLFPQDKRLTTPSLNDPPIYFAIRDCELLADRPCCRDLDGCYPI